MTDKATPRPWRHRIYETGHYITFDGIIRDATIAAMNTPCTVYNNPHNDAQLIVTAVNAWDSPELLRKRIAELEGK